MGNLWNWISLEKYEDYTSSHMSGSKCLFNLDSNINDLDESKCITFNMTSPSLNRCEEVTSLAHSLFRQKKLNNILDEDISGDTSKV
jgi:hypothetical protein